jgi:hypothetical protein
MRGSNEISLRHQPGHAGFEATNRYVHFAANKMAAIQQPIAIRTASAPPP